MPTPKTDFRGMSDEQLALTLKETEKTVFSLRSEDSGVAIKRSAGGSRTGT